MAKLVLDHVGGFCQPWRKSVFSTCPWAKKGKIKKRKIWSLERKHSTVRRRISNLPIPEVYSRHNEAVTHLLLNCASLLASYRGTHAGAGAAATTSTSTVKEIKRQSSVTSALCSFPTEATWNRSTQPSSFSIN